MALAAGLIAWIVIDRRDDSKTSTTSGPVPPTMTVPRTGPVIVSAAGLQTLARVVGDPIYWAGPRQKTFYELTRTTSANVYVRYLPPGVDAGAPKGNYLIVATYPFPGAFDALKKAAHGRERQVPGGAIALVDAGYPQSVHLAWPDVDYQIEVYHPSPARALAVALSGGVKPVR